jgi:RHS repeat-associated protein
MISSTKYFYSLDHLRSLREVTDNSGVIQAQYNFDPFGQVTRIKESVATDFGYAGYCVHARSGLNLTFSRAYNPSLGRWISRDPIGELGGHNLYAYVDNIPTIFTDPFGFSAATPTPPPVNPFKKWDPEKVCPLDPCWQCCYQWYLYDKKLAKRNYGASGDSGAYWAAIQRAKEDLIDCYVRCDRGVKCVPPKGDGPPPKPPLDDKGKSGPTGSGPPPPNQTPPPQNDHGKKQK